MAQIAYPTPSIVRETSTGFSTISIASDMFAHREIECVGVVDEAMTYSICQQLRQLQREDPFERITIFFNSPGGQVQSGLAIYDTMQAVSCPVRTVCLGMAASMSALLFMAGDQRDMLPHARILIHDPLTVGGDGGSALELKTKAEQLMRTREITAEVISKHTGRPIEEVFEKTRHDTWFEAEEAVEWGIADQIIDCL